MPKTDATGLGQIQELGIQSISPTGMVETQLPTATTAATKGLALTANWSQELQPGIKPTHSIWNAGIRSRSLITEPNTHPMYVIFSIFFKLTNISNKSFHVNKYYTSASFYYLKGLFIYLFEAKNYKQEGKEEERGRESLIC